MQIVKVENMNGTLVTTSNRVAEELGVNHRDLLEKIRQYLVKFSTAETSALFYIPSNYKASNGKTNPNYLITEKGIAQLIGGYSSAVEKAFDLNVAYINKFEEMKQQLQLKAPTTLKEALVLALKQQEEIEQLQGTITVQTQVIEEFRPKKEYLDTILASEGTLCISQIAADYGMSGNKLNSILNQQKIIRKINNQWLLYSEHFEKGYTKSETFTVKKGNGAEKVILHTKWTQKGRLKIHEILTSLGIKANMDKEKSA